MNSSGFLAENILAIFSGKLILNSLRSLLSTKIPKIFYGVYLFYNESVWNAKKKIT